GLDPILPMFLQGLMFGTPETREQAALGLGDLISMTSTTALAPFVIKITGPLIRIIGDRFPAKVKAAILHTLMYVFPLLPFYHDNNNNTNKTTKNGMISHNFLVSQKKTKTYHKEFCCKVTFVLLFVT
ncbi:eIF-2-alpha kinase activator GCN1, partial [Coelomomyces lativittatus]